jgi:hypothetical protein
VRGTTPPCLEKTPYRSSRRQSWEMKYPNTDYRPP